jgi:hypothetical protein
MSIARKTKEERNEELDAAYHDQKYWVSTLVAEAKVLGEYEYRVRKATEMLEHIWGKAFGIAP